jgi:hypothetical protein
VLQHGEFVEERITVVLQWRLHPTYEIGGITVGDQLSQFESGAPAQGLLHL